MGGTVQLWKFYTVWCWPRVGFKPNHSFNVCLIDKFFIKSHPPYLSLSLSRSFLQSFFRSFPPSLFPIWKDHSSFFKIFERDCSNPSWIKSQAALNRLIVNEFWTNFCVNETTSFQSRLSVGLTPFRRSICRRLFITLDFTFVSRKNCFFSLPS